MHVEILSSSNETSYQLLKFEIEETFGKKISNAGDCLLVSEEVYAKISFTVNSNTLRRFFGLVKSPYLPSATTLDILSKYCGFASYDEFKRVKNNTGNTAHSDHYSESILNYLVSLFKHTPVKDYHDKAFIAVVKHTIQFLFRHPEFINKFQRAIAKTKNGQDFYFEQFVNIDALNSFYGEGIRHYLVEKNTAEAKILGHSLLCLRYWLSDNQAALHTHHDEVIKHHLTKSMHPILCARFFATQLYCSEASGMPVEKILAKAQHAHASLKHKTDDSRFFPYFEYIFAPTLLLTGHPEEAFYYINYSVNNYPQKHANVDQGLYQNLDLVKALTFAKTGRKKEAKQLYNHVHPSKFYFMTKKTNTIMYLFLAKYLNKNNEKSDQQLRDLIAETGFTRLNRLLE